MSCNYSDTLVVACNGHGVCGMNNECDCLISWGNADCSLEWSTWTAYTAYRWTMFTISFIITIICIWRLILVVRARMRASLDNKLWTALYHVQSVTLMCITFGQLCATIRMVDPFVVTEIWPKGFQQFLNSCGQMCALGVAAGLIDFFLSIHAAFHLPSRVVRRILHRLVAAWFIAEVLLYIVGVTAVISLSLWNVIYGIFTAIFLIASLVGCQRYIRTILNQALREPNRLSHDQSKSLRRIASALRSIQIVVTGCVFFSLVSTTIFYYDYQLYPVEAIATDAPAWLMPWLGYLAGLIVIGNPTKMVRRKGWKPTSSGGAGGHNNTMSRQGPYISAIHHSQGPGSPQGGYTPNVNGGTTPGGHHMVMVAQARTPLPNVTSNGPTSARDTTTTTQAIATVAPQSMAYSHIAASMPLTQALFAPRTTTAPATAATTAAVTTAGGVAVVNNSGGGMTRATVVPSPSFVHAHQQQQSYQPFRDEGVTTRPNSNDNNEGVPT